MADLRMLGPMIVLDDAGKTIGLPGARPRALLALLALDSPSVVSTDLIVETLWGDESLTRPGATLHTTVNRLRKSLGDVQIVTEPGGYRLDIPTDNSDISRFRAWVRRGKQMATLGHPLRACEAFRNGLGQWRGPALLDLRQFDFAERAGNRLEEERITAVEDLMEAMLAAGHHDQVASELSGLVDGYPFRERMWRLLAIALYRAGRQAEALAALLRLRSRLGDELGVEPSPDVLDLEERILLHDPSLLEFERAPAPLADHIEYVSFSAGDLIVKQDDLASTVYWIEEGRVEVVEADSSGRTRKVTELGPGRYFGELSVILGARRAATVRALVPSTVSTHDLDSFRARLLLERTQTAEPRGGDVDLWDLMSRGEYLQVYDRAAHSIHTGSASVEIRYLAVLALARSGATTQARRRYQQYGLANIDATGLARALADDIAVLAARLDKDEALARPQSSPGRREWSERAARRYEEAFERSGATFHAVNAASMWLLAGEEEMARSLACDVLDSTDVRQSEYWRAATEAEAALVTRDVARAERAMARAGRAGDASAAHRATTLRQLKLVCAAVGIESEILDPLRNPPVVHYCGHRILPEGESGRFPAAEEGRVSTDLREEFERLDTRVAFGSLAAGADVLAAEALLDRGAELHVILPFERDEFVRTSVISAGNGWVERFERCLAGAATVEVASSGGHFGDPVMFDFCARIAMGDALMRARHLETEAHQVAVWDRTTSAATAGTSIDVERWAAAGAASTIIPVTAGAAPGWTQPGDVRRIRAIVLADFAGFSGLSDAQQVTFQDVLTKEIATTIAPHRARMRSGRTTGGSMQLVFTEVEAAAECALDLVDAVGSLDLASRGLPQVRGLRIGTHAAPVFEGWDPISGEQHFFGVGLTRAAHIEARTPEGEIYATHAFAALAFLSGNDAFECQYVGTMPTAGQSRAMPLYALRRVRHGLR